MKAFPSSQKINGDLFIDSTPKISPLRNKISRNGESKKVRPINLELPKILHPQNNTRETHHVHSKYLADFQ